MNNFVDGAQKFRERYNKIYSGPHTGTPRSVPVSESESEESLQNREDAKMAENIENPLHKYVCVCLCVCVCMYVCIYAKMVESVENLLHK